MRRRRATALLIDFDGVLRWHDERAHAELEAANNVDEGAILAIASDPAILIPALLGRVSRAGWLTDIAAALADRVGGLDRAGRIVAEWDTNRGEIVPEVHDTLAALRAEGVPVALCTNATDDLRDDLARFALSDAFDAVVSSAEIGAVKPMREFYLAACEAVATPPANCLFVDDTQRNVDGARAAGLLAYRFSGVDGLAYIRAAFKTRD